MIERHTGARGDVLVVRGELDLTNASEITEALSETTSDTVGLDLTELAFIDSAGLRTIDQEHRRLAAEGRALVIVAPAESRAAWTFRVAGFSDTLLHDSLEAALLSLARDAGS
jgi:anti-anti-sigma factor